MRVSSLSLMRVSSLDCGAVRFQVLAVKLTGTYPCGTSAGAPPVITRGWGGGQPCTCDPKGQFLNCNGVPQLTVSLRRRANSTATAREWRPMSGEPAVVSVETAPV